MESLMLLVTFWFQLCLYFGLPCGLVGWFLGRWLGGVANALLCELVLAAVFGPALMGALPPDRLFSGAGLGLLFFTPPAFVMLVAGTGLERLNRFRVTRDGRSC
jgi:hypothetical protein